MRSQTAAVMAGLAVLVASIATAVVMTVTTGGDTSPGHRDSMSAGSGAMAHVHGSRVASEYDYLSEMVAHHEEAVVAARELERSERPEMRAFGDSIVESQTAQIDQMQHWLDDWYPDRSGQVDYQTMTRDLTGLSGDELDRVFLEDMVGHHMAAVMMSQQLLARGVADHAQVDELARTIRDDQHAEIFEMQQWLDDWFGR
ncbi:MAG: DUF305 domain-containing protein [Actinomycetia bacterium]|nr:DUF305 domain-containing protein [Actinomycetes bacterium]